MSEKDKLDLILETLNELSGRVTRTETDSIKALESVASLVKTLKKNNPDAPMTAAGAAGIGLDQVLKLIADTEERTTNRIEKIIGVVQSANQASRKEFESGLALGQELAALAAAAGGDGDDEDAGAGKYLELLNTLTQVLSAGRKGKLNGVSHYPIPNGGGQAPPNSADHGGENS